MGRLKQMRCSSNQCYINVNFIKILHSCPELFKCEISEWLLDHPVFLFLKVHITYSISPENFMKRENVLSDVSYIYRMKSAKMKLVYRKILHDKYRRQGGQLTLSFDSPHCSLRRLVIVFPNVNTISDLSILHIDSVFSLVIINYGLRLSWFVNRTAQKSI